MESVCSTRDGTLFGHGVTADRSIAIAITGDPVRREFDGYVMAPTETIYLRVFRREDCQQVRIVALSFPEKATLESPLLFPKNKYWSNARLVDSFAKYVAVSPDNSKIAVSYAIRRGDPYSDALSRVGIYALADGARLVTLEAGVVRNGLWTTIRQFDAVPTSGYAASRAVFFSPDSKYLYGGSDKLRRWDLFSLLK